MRVAIEPLTQQELDLLVAGFRIYLPLHEDDLFAGLLAKLDQVEAVQLGPGFTLVPLQSSSNYR